MSLEYEKDPLDEAIQFRARMSVGRELTDEELIDLRESIENKMVTLIATEYLIEGPNYDPVNTEELAKNYGDMLRPHIERLVADYMEGL